MQEQENIISLSLSNHRNIFLTTSFKNAEIAIKCQFVDDLEKKTYSGVIPEAKLKQIASDFESNIDLFVRESKQALITSGGHPDFKYAIEEKDNCFRLIWKKIIDQVSLVYGSVELKEEKQDQSIVFQLIDKLQRNEDELNALQNRNEKLQKDHLELLQSYQILLDQKNNTETKLYSKFRLILNSKKTEILELKNEVEQLKKKSQIDDNSDFGDETTVTVIPNRNRIISQSSSEDFDKINQEKEMIIKPIDPDVVPKETIVFSQDTQTFDFSDFM